MMMMVLGHMVLICITLQRGPGQCNGDDGFRSYGANLHCLNSTEFLYKGGQVNAIMMMVLGYMVLLCKVKTPQNSYTKGARSMIMMVLG